MRKILSILKSFPRSGNNTPATRSRANSIDLDSSYDMIGYEERAEMVAQVLIDEGFISDSIQTEKRIIKKTAIMPDNK